MYSGSKYRLVSRVKDRRSFNIEYLEYYSLLLQVGAQDFQICVTDTRNNACLLVEDYIFEDVDSDEGLVSSLRQLYDEHHFLLANFWHSVTLSVKNEKFALAPRELFSDSHYFDYLKFNASLNPAEEQYFHSEIKNIGAVAIFAVEKSLIQFINSVYRNITCKLIHQSCALIEGIVKNQDLRPYRQMYVYLDRIHMHISVLEEKELVYYNQFYIRNFSDYVKYIMLAARTFDFDVQRNPILIWGYHNQDSRPLNELNKYLGDIRFGHGPSFLKMGFEFDEIPEHHYLDLFGIYLCA